jgi:hypothetical protein
MSLESSDALETAPVPEEIQQGLNAICASNTFRRSDRLKRFLRYVSELTLKGEAGRINEYLIAMEVFDRDGNYTPSEDAIVRRQAHALRQKLQQYYANEGKNATITIDLPLGGYVPVFRRIREPENDLTAVVQPQGLARTPHFHWTIRRKLLAAASSLLVVAVAFLGGWIAGRHSLKEVAVAEKFGLAAREVWGSWLTDPAGATICFSNPLSTIIDYYKDPLPLDNSQLHQLPASRFEDKVLRRAFGLPSDGYVYWAPATSQTKTGEAIGAVRLTSFFARAGVPLRTTQSRFLSWEVLRRDNFIIFGHNEANRWLDPLLDQYPFHLAATGPEGPRCILNNQAKSDELRQYCLQYADTKNSPNVEYALVSMIPGIDGNHRLLLINGLNTQATETAAEFLTDEGTLSNLASRLHSATPKHAPWHMQLVFRTEVRDKVPTKVSLMTFRVF